MGLGALAMASRSLLHAHTHTQTYRFGCFTVLHRETSLLEKSGLVRVLWLMEVQSEVVVVVVGRS